MNSAPPSETLKNDFSRCSSKGPTKGLEKKKRWVAHQKSFQAEWLKDEQKEQKIFQKNYDWDIVKLPLSLPKIVMTWYAGRQKEFQ